MAQILQTDLIAALRFAEGGLRNEKQSGQKSEIANPKFKNPGFTRALVAGVFVLMQRS